MAEKKKIQGFLHYRTDLGDGVRTGVVFSGCTEDCAEICSPYRFLEEHGFCEDTAEKKEYTAEELLSYLLEEKTLYYTKKLGVTFLGKEPLRDPFFCADIAAGLRDADIRLQIYTCGMCSMTAFEVMDGLVELYVLRVFLPFFNEACPNTFHRSAQSRRIIDHFETRATPYRILLTFGADTSLKEVDRFADFISDFKALKSVMLDFSKASFHEDEQRRFRKIFLERRIPLY